MAAEVDHRFAARVQSAIATAQAWDDDPLLLAECRAMIPFEELRDDGGPHSEPSDRYLSSNARFLQRLARWYKSNMTWVNSPACQVCQSTETTSLKETRGPVSPEELEGSAGRVEVYSCSRESCNQATTTFPRYNSPRKLLESRKGRCGEYANLFGLFCRALGLETRYISDWTDHVWTEVYLVDSSSWVMIDSCESVLAETSMYEAGWGKKLNFIVGATVDHVVDLTPRYTRMFQTPDFQARRRAVVSSEQMGRELLRQANQRLQIGLAPKARAELERRLSLEENQLTECRKLTEWEREYGRGRISGSMAWKVARQEAGKAEELKDKKDVPPPGSFHVESFFPPTSLPVSISVHPSPQTRHDGIVVSGTACALGNPDSLSVVVIDEKYDGCILQSRSFRQAAAFADFVDSLPTQRIVAVQGSLPEPHVNEALKKRLKQLGGFDCEFIAEGVLFIGQVRARPDWAYCGSFSSTPHGIGIRQTRDSDTKELKLSTKREMRPACIAGRLPETAMPLQNQLLASHEHKRTAFLSFVKKEGYNTSSGYATMKNAPIYLLGNGAYPLERVESDEEEAWTTFLLLPPPLVGDDDIGIVQTAKANAETPKFDIPIESTFFTSHLGPELLIKQNGSASMTDTLAALHNARLIGLYFSAHWCGPCRSFTPMLAEMYQHLKDAFPSHGLEIIFVSSDRDPGSFHQYYASMPWAALPFEGASFGNNKQLLSMKYGVQGIPSFVVLDAMSGEVVSSTATSRKEVMEACHRGEDGIESLLRSWFDRVPTSTTEMMNMLALSCIDDKHTPDNNTDEAVNPYLVRPSTATSPTKEEIASKVKSKFAQLVTEGMTPNEAAAKAIAIIATGSQEDENVAGPLNGKFTRVSLNGGDKDWTDQCLEQMLSDKNGRDHVHSVLTTILKYTENAKKSPWTPKFRHFKLSNKVADRITRVTGGVDLIRSVGLDIVATDQDFCGSIPIAIDLDRLEARINKVLEQVRPITADDK